MRKSNLVFACLGLAVLLFVIRACIFQRAGEKADLAVVHAPVGAPKSFVNSIGIKMILVNSGSFLMGTDKEIKLWDYNAGPAFGPSHKVTLSAFYIASTEVTKVQFKKFVNETGIGADLPQIKVDTDPSMKKYIYGNAPNDHFPIHHIDWFTANQFCDWLSKKENKKYRLPTEAEWECACRAGTQTKYWWGEYWKISMVAYRNNIDQDPFSGIIAPGTYAANPWGLYEIYGNALEWVMDWYDENYYKNSAEINPTGPQAGQNKVLRGGWLGSLMEGCNSLDRAFEDPYGYWAGIRLVCEVEENMKFPSIAKKTKQLEVNLEKGLKYETVHITPKIDLKIVYIKPGSFVMGSPKDETEYRSEHEGPQTKVTLTKGFYIGVYEITQEQYESIMLENPSPFKDKSKPAHNIPCYFAHEFCKKLTQRLKTENKLPDGAVYRLPTEPEWEYACRAGTTTTYNFGNSAEDLDYFAHYDTTDGPQSVGQKLSNSWGLYDMHGNVWEWCDDAFNAYKGNEVIDPIDKFHTTGMRVARGGGWNFSAHRCRSATRFALAGSYPDSIRQTEHYNFAGFRIVRTLGKDEKPPE